MLVRANLSWEQVRMKHQDWMSEFLSFLSERRSIASHHTKKMLRKDAQEKKLLDAYCSQNNARDPPIATPPFTTLQIENEPSKSN